MKFAQAYVHLVGGKTGFHFRSCVLLDFCFRDGRILQRCCCCLAVGCEDRHVSAVLGGEGATYRVGGIPAPRFPLRGGYGGAGSHVK